MATEIAITTVTISEDIIIDKGILKCRFPKKLPKHNKGE